MALMSSFPMGTPFSNSGCGCRPGPAAGGGFPLSPLGGMDPMAAMNSQMMTMFSMTLMAMLTQLMQMLSGGSALSSMPGQFGGAPGGGVAGGSPLESFLGGGGAPAAAPSGQPVGATGSGAHLGPADGSVSPSTQNFINKALSKQGTPYVFGAAGPDKFDCSGLVSWALKEAGVSGGRTTARGLQDRYKDTAITRKEDLRPGDLVFFWSPNNRGIPRGQASHVEIYLGNGQTMGTDSPKEGAKVEPINWDTFIGGARVPELNR